MNGTKICIDSVHENERQMYIIDVSAIVTKKLKMIGVIGGMGPYAGIDLVKNIFDMTKASSDQEHVPLSMISLRI